MMGFQKMKGGKYYYIEFLGYFRRRHGLTVTAVSQPDEHYVVRCRGRFLATYDNLYDAVGLCGSMVIERKRKERKKNERHKQQRHV